jgi:hypothetical protein
MPGFDGRGPNGEGAMTGRGAGRCPDTYRNEQSVDNSEVSSNETGIRFVGYGRRFFRRGFGKGASQGFFGRGRGRGCR